MEKKSGYSAKYCDSCFEHFESVTHFLGNSVLFVFLNAVKVYSN